MRLVIHVLLAIQLILPGIVLAESCDTDCHRQCRIRTDFPPIEFIEPTCHAKCEVAKKAACATGTSLPTIPLTPREQVETYGTQACSAPFQAITGVVIAQCSNWDGRTENQHLIANAINQLQSVGILSPGELNGVQVRWCPLSGAHGMAPDRGRIYLDTSLQGNAYATASTLAHEITHIRQYRRMGTDRFKCDYSRQYAECGGCQDRRNSFEREAYDCEASIQGRLSQFTPHQLPQQQPMQLPQTGIPVRYCQTQLGTCQIPPAMVPMGTQCFCNAQNGQQIPGSAF
jgi:hypothetical protein